MNIVFLDGKIISKIEFKFIIENNNKLSKKHTSICYFDILCSNFMVIKIKEYDEIAELCYRKLKTEDYICVCGRLNQKYEIEIKEFYIM